MLLFLLIQNRCATIIIVLFIILILDVYDHFISVVHGRIVNANPQRNKTITEKKVGFPPDFTFSIRFSSNMVWWLYFLCTVILL